MRCVNCGWNNPEGVTKCQKCNQLLPTLPSAVEETVQKNVKQEKSFQATMRDINRPPFEDVPKEMKATKRLVTEEEIAQPKESHSEDIEKKSNGMKLIPLEGGDVIECGVFPFSIRRSMNHVFDMATDENLQAEITFSEGDFFIEDKSINKNTYVLASRKIKLEDGDIVILGGKRFVIG